MDEAEIRALLKKDTQQVAVNTEAASANPLALLDVNDYIARHTQHMKISMKSILDHFTKAPYGFVDADVQWLVAKLFRDGDIALSINSETITLHSRSVDEIVRYLTRKEYTERLMMEKRIKANEKQKKAVREVMKELFRDSSTSEDDDTLMHQFSEDTKKLKQFLDNLEKDCYSKVPQYPGKNVVQAGKRLVNLVLSIPSADEFFATVDSQRDEFLDFAEDFEPVKKFFAGDQLRIFNQAIEKVAIFDDSKTFIVNDEIEQTIEQIKAIMKKPAPYGEIYKLPGLLAQYINAYDEVLEEMSEPILEALDAAKARVYQELEDKDCKVQLTGKFYEKFKELRDKATHCNNVATLQNIKVEADALKVRCLNEISAAETLILKRKAAEAERRSAQEAAARAAAGEAPEAPAAPAAPEPPKPKIKKQKTVSIKSINTSSTWQLESADDVRRYVSELQAKLLRALEEDTIINVEF